MTAKVKSINKYEWEFQNSTPAVIPGTIANGASLSGALVITENYPTGLILPALWTAADLTFQGSADGVNFYNIYDSAGTEVTVKAAASRLVRLTPADWVGLMAIKIRSGTSGTPVAQGADRIINIIAKAL